jgi:hypothetical protein
MLILKNPGEGGESQSGDPPQKGMTDMLKSSTTVPLCQLEEDEIFDLVLTEAYCCRFVTGSGPARWVAAVKMVADFGTNLLDSLTILILLNNFGVRKRAMRGEHDVTIPGTYSDGTRTDVLIQFTESHLSIARHVISAFAKSMQDAGVPTEKGYPYPNRNTYLSIYNDSKGGKCLCGDTLPVQPLRSPELLLKHWTDLYYLLLPICLSPQRAEATKQALFLQATKGRCFAKARYLASYGMASEKSWDRNLKRLRGMGLARTIRLQRPNRELSTNLLDLRRLWSFLLRILSQSSCHWEKVGREVWYKLSGAWVSLPRLLYLDVGPPDPVGLASRGR